MGVNDPVSVGVAGGRRVAVAGGMVIVKVVVKEIVVTRVNVPVIACDGVDVTCANSGGVWKRAPNNTAITRPMVTQVEFFTRQL